jgi:hypothetical protein
LPKKSKKALQGKEKTMRTVNIFSCIVLLAAVALTSAAPPNTAFTYQGRLHHTGDPANGLYDFSFRLMNELKEGNQLGQKINLEDVMLTNGYFVVSLDFGPDVFDGTPLFLDIAVTKNSKLPFPKVTLSPRQPITPTPYAISAQRLCGTVDASQITGLLGQGFTLLFPDIMYNRATLEMDGIHSPDPVVVLVGPGVDIDRVEGFNSSGMPSDNPGFAMEHPFVFEMGEPYAVEMKNYFDTYLANPKNTILRNFSLIIRNLGAEEVMRWNFASFTPQNYAPGLDGRTRFTLAVNPAPDRTLQWQMAGPDFGADGSYNPATDRLLEIDGIMPVYSQVKVDTANRTLTFTHSIDEGRGLYGWVRSVVQGLNYKRNISVVQFDEDRQEIGRDNYHDCFPIRYEVLEGFALDTKLTVRIILAYNRHQPI